jgi:HEPN domain-containing protein
MPDNREYVLEWFEKASRDLASARILYEGSGPADIIAEHLHQATEKYLKGYLISVG